MNTADLLSRLEGVKGTGARRWMARCPAHSDGSASLSVREADDGRTLVNCFGGCQAGEVVGAVGLTLSDLFPKGSTVAAHGRRTAVPVGDILEAIRIDTFLVCVIAADLAKGAQLDDRRRELLTSSASRLATAIHEGPQKYEPRGKDRG